MEQTRATRNLATALAALALTTSCYGPFNATRQLHKWNGEISDNEWVVEGLFVVAVLIPVYGIFILGDAIIFNSIEFWGGENPIASPSAALDGNGRALRFENLAATDGSIFRARIVSAGGVEEELCTETDARGVISLSRANGLVLATLEPLANGDVVLRDGLGREVARGSAAPLSSRAVRGGPGSAVLR